MDSQPTQTDPIARLCVFVLIVLAVYANVAQLAPRPTNAQVIILDATPTPALPTPAPALAPIEVAPAPTLAPLQPLPDAAPAPIEVAPIQIDAAPIVEAQIDAESAPPPQVTTEAAPPIDVVLNDPALNGGNVAPDGCPFPIINGVCANGVRAKDIEESMFGSKSIAEEPSDPHHATKERSR